MNHLDNLLLNALAIVITSSVGHTKIPLFFPNMDISIAIREDVRKNASVKKSGSFVKYSRCNSTFKF